MRFNVVVANPPFSLDKWGAENATNDRFTRFHRDTPPTSKGDYAFLSHMIETTYLDPIELELIIDRVMEVAEARGKNK
jgi:type I restriction enzyme M protein